MKYIILIQTGYEVDCSPKKLQDTIKLLKKDQGVLTVDYVRGKK